MSPTVLDLLAGLLTLYIDLGRGDSKVQAHRDPMGFWVRVTGASLMVASWAAGGALVGPLLQVLGLALAFAGTVHRLVVHNGGRRLLYQNQHLMLPEEGS